MAETRPIHWQNTVTLVSVLILVGAEVFGVAIAGGWALAGLFQLGDPVTYGLMGVFSVLGAYAMWALWRRAVRIEPIRV